MTSNKLRYHKWDINDTKKLYRSFKNVINDKAYDFQYYIPLMSLYFYFHNTKNSNKIIDFERRFYIREINELLKDNDYNSNCILNISLFDSKKNQKYITDAFCKSISILDIQHILSDNYNLINKHNPLLSSPYNYNSFSKINDIHNSAYIDLFCSYLFGKITENNILPNFGLFYGSFNCISNIKYDITSEYSALKNEHVFSDKIRKLYTLTKYSDNCETESNLTDNSPSIDTVSEDDDDYMLNIRSVPTLYIFTEKLNETLEEVILDETFNSNVLLSCLFQISFALSYLQKKYLFTHNDLHINNIMYSKTKREHIYYKINNKYYKIPTYGKIYKIIDFGRSILTYNNKIYHNDCFSKFGEAHGQYYYPDQIRFLKKKYSNEIIKPNYSFDLCRLSITILDLIRENNIIITDELLNLLNKMVMKNDVDSFMDNDEDFDLYINISKYSKNAIPQDILNNNIFKQFLLKKRKISKRYNIYKMD